MTTFAAQVDAAMDAARAKSEFVLSRKETEDALAPVVADLLAMDHDAAAKYIVASFRGAGTMDALALSLFIAAR